MRARKKNFFYSWDLLSWFVAFQIRLNFANQMKTELGYKLWSWDNVKLFATHYFDVLFSSQAKKISKLVRTSRISKCWIAKSFNICLNFKACNWAQFSSDLQNSNEFEMLRISSINPTKKKFFLRVPMLRTQDAFIYIY
jgi:hypothetical protein